MKINTNQPSFGMSLRKPNLSQMSPMAIDGLNAAKATIEEIAKGVDLKPSVLLSEETSSIPKIIYSELYMRNIEIPQSIWVGRYGIVASKEGKKTLGEKIATFIGLNTHEEYGPMLKSQKLPSTVEEWKNKWIELAINAKEEYIKRFVNPEKIDYSGQYLHPFKEGPDHRLYR